MTTLERELLVTCINSISRMIDYITYVPLEYTDYYDVLTTIITLVYRDI